MTQANAVDKVAFFERCWPAGQRMAEISPKMSRTVSAYSSCTGAARKKRKDFRNLEMFQRMGKHIRAVSIHLGAA